ncbi:MAG: NAD(P)/FAD-dependent oxidoreductase [Gammaproteobacteria bacterium]
MRKCKHMDRRLFTKLLGSFAIAYNSNVRALVNRDSVVVVGAGIIGTTIAYELSKMGAKVTLIDKESPASGASGSSFSWINATYPKKPYSYNLLSQLGIDAYKNLEKEINLNINWSGSLEWFDSMDAQKKLLSEVAALRQYPKFSPLRIITDKKAKFLEPNVNFSSNQNIILSEADGAIDTMNAISLMIEKIKQFGGSVLHPCQFQGLNYRNGQLSSLQTSLGELEADQVVFACGVDTDNLLSINSITAPKPGVIVRTKPSEKLLNKIVVGPGVHVHQQLDGRIIFGEQAGAPNSHLERLKEKPKNFPSDLFAQQHEARILKMATTFINKLDNLEIEKTSIGWRPLPRDGKPVIGRLDQLSDVYVAVMHSGVSLAAIVGKLVTQEILDRSTNLILQDFRPSRFN